MKHRKIMIILLPILIIIFGISGTLAYYKINISSETEIQVSRFDTTIETLYQSPPSWNLGSTDTYNFAIKNVSNSPFMVRVKVDDVWVDNNNNEYTNIVNGEKIAKLNFVNASDWKKIGNYYYYKYEVEENETTSNLVSGITFNSNYNGTTVCTYDTTNNTESCINSPNDYTNLTYKVIFTSDIIRSSGYEEVWNVLNSEVTADSTYSVNFIPNMTEVTGTMENENFIYGTSKALTTNAYTKTGYVFNSWNTKYNGTGISYGDEEEVLDIANGDTDILNLYAIWNNLYSVEFASTACPLNVETYANISNIVYGNLIKQTAIPNPECIGYKFAGWTASGDINTSTARYGVAGNSTTAWTNGNKGTFFKNLSTTGNGIVTLTANWTINTNILTIKPAGGSVGIESPTGGTAQNIEADTTKTQNYNTTLTYGKPTKANSTSTSSKWTVSYNTSGGSTAPASEDLARTIVTSYAFDKWTTSGTCGTLSSATDAGVYTFPANDGTSCIMTATYTSSVASDIAEEITLPAAPTKEGYTFAGWKTGNTTKQPGDKYTPTADTTFTAQWTYTAAPTITRSDYNTFTYSSTVGSAYYVSTTQTTKPANAAAQSAFALDTWTSATTTGDLILANGQTYYVWVKDASGNVSANNKTITVVSVTRSVGTGSILTTKYENGNGTEFTFGTTYVLSGTVVYANAGLQTGYKDVVLKKNNESSANNATHTITANTTFASSATLTTYTIGYTLNGGTVEAANPTSYNVTTNTITLNNPTKEGYTFAGWTGSNGNTPQTTVTIAKGSTGNKTYTANWTYTAAPTITRSDYNTFTYSSAAGSAYYVSTTQTTAPANDTAQSAFALDTWTSATTTGDLQLVKGTYYVWVKDASGNVSANKATINSYEITRAATNTSLTTKYDSSSGTAFTSTVNVLAGTTLYASCTANTGYNTPVLNHGSTTLTASGETFTVSASEAITCTSTANKYTVEFASTQECPLNTTTYANITNISYDTLVKETAIANPTCTGYTFTGWTASGDINTSTAKYGITSSPATAWVNGNKGTFFKNLSTTNNGTVTLTAGWTPTIYEISLNNQSATTIGTTEIFEKYSTNWYSESSATNVITTITKPVKTGYYFDGYYTGQNGTGTKVIDSNGTILSTNTAFTSNTTLYANWVEVWAENLSFNGNFTGFNCSDTQCAIGELYDLLISREKK